ncbi:MAG: DMT family transporter [Rubrivivax sp.]|nr:DMT family transporter [Rubrivivax sp.]
MSRRNLLDLTLLAALWGASFLFMRLGAHEFGPLVLAFLRVTGAALMLLPLLAWRGEATALRGAWRAIAAVGVMNYALPFALFALAALVLSTALMSVFNATTPIWGALVAWLWLGERLTPSRWLGLAIGTAGVVALSWGKADMRPGEHGVSAAVGIAACVVASVLYGVAANVSRRYLASLPPMALAAGSQLAASTVLLVPALATWPTVNPGPKAWLAVAALAFLCTGLAYALYFRLIVRAGATQAMSVTFLIPAFALLWGWLLLDETPTLATLAGCTVILLGTALATGLVKLPGLRSG